MPVMDGAIVGGSYTLRDSAEQRERGLGPVPVFSFHATDLERARALLRDMYVELDVRLDAGGRLAYVLGVPDRQLEPAAIAVDEREAPHIASAAARHGGVVTLVVDDHGGSVPLDRFSVDLAHDWTRNYARALQAFQADDLDVAIGALQFLVDTRSEVPAVHHLLGRCHRARGDLRTAIHHYLGAVHRACGRLGEHLLPAAAGPLTDLAFAFKRLGSTGKAAHCLLHALHLRPNHPEALLGFVTVFPQTDALVVHALARVVALGGREDMLTAAIAGITAARGGDPADLRRQAEDAALRVDLSTWPLARADLERYTSFHDGLQRLGTSTIAGSAASSASLPVTEEHPARPWWKFW